MQPDSYMLLHRMLGAARTKREKKIVLRRFQAVVAANIDSDNRDDIFDAAWAMSCIASLYAGLNEPLFVERAYLESLRLFDKNAMSFNAAGICVELAEHYVRQGRMAEAETKLKENIAYHAKEWGKDNHHIKRAEVELRHFHLTGRIAPAFGHKWCEACSVENDEMSPAPVTVARWRTVK